MFALFIPSQCALLGHCPFLCLLVRQTPTTIDLHQIKQALQKDRKETHTRHHKWNRQFSPFGFAHIVQSEPSLFSVWLLDPNPDLSWPDLAPWPKPWPVLTWPGALTSHFQNMADGHVFGISWFVCVSCFQTSMNVVIFDRCCLVGNSRFALFTLWKWI